MGSGHTNGRQGPKVVILGGGVGGLSAAHELIERGFEVHVYEANPDLGGKARSQPVAGTGTDGRLDLPGEHGFRFYPRFYTHLIDTMQRIPQLDDPSKHVVDNLRETTEAAIAADDGQDIHRFYRRRPTTPFGILESLELFFADMDVDSADVGMFSLKVLQYLTSCDERRLAEYEGTPWWDYLGGDHYSDNFRRYLRAVPRTMVAMDAKRGSARSIGNISMQLLVDFTSDGVNQDRTMNGPTTEAWIRHWHAHLDSLGVVFHLGKRVESFEFDGASITGVRIQGENSPVTGDYFVAGLPIDVMSKLISADMGAADPALDKLRTVDMSWITSWMVGIQFYLYEDVPMVPGHVFYPDSPWALTSISQAQFWRESGMFRQRYGNGSVGGCLSVDISEWFEAGSFNGKAAKDCTREEIAEEVWKQLKVAINDPENPILKDENLHSWHLDDDVDFSSGTAWNTSRLLVHPPGSWAYRPEAATRIKNLMLASDYVRTSTDLASMEGANEAARRAVNAILDRAGMDAERCTIWPLCEPSWLDPIKRHDRNRFDAGRPHLFESVQVNSLFGVAKLLRRVAAAVGLDALDDFLDRHKLTRYIESGVRRLGIRNIPAR